MPMVYIVMYAIITAVKSTILRSKHAISFINIFCSKHKIWVLARVSNIFVLGAK